MLEKIKKNKFVSFLTALLVLVTGNTAMQTLGSSSSVSTTASTTAYSLSYASSQRIVATSSKRTSVVINSENCASTRGVFLNLESPDAAAATSSGPVIYASSTHPLVLGGEEYLPSTVGNSIQAFSAGGACTLIVTELIEAF
jgi:hypothetical protein